MIRISTRGRYALRAMWTWPGTRVTALFPVKISSNDRRYPPIMWPSYSGNFRPQAWWKGSRGRAAGTVLPAMLR